MHKLRRTETRYVWAQKYAMWRDMHRNGKMPLDIWQAIDGAYDVRPKSWEKNATVVMREQCVYLLLVTSFQFIYEEKARVLYDFWGPHGAQMTDLLNIQLSVGYFYLLWFGIMCGRLSFSIVQLGFPLHFLTQFTTVTLSRRNDAHATRENCATCRCLGCDAILFVRWTLS